MSEPSGPISAETPAAANEEGAQSSSAEKNQSSSDAQDTEPEEWEVQRDHHKTAGDAAFRSHAFRTAIDEYTKAISLDPDFVVAYSNRSAAYLKNSETSKALRDAQRIVELDPSFAKGHSRLAAALHALRRYEAAQKEYREVLKLDAGNSAAAKGVEDCQNELDRIAKEREEEQRLAEELLKGKQEQAEEEADKDTEQPKDEPKEEEADDDMLGDFFDEVEEVTKKPEEEPIQAKATNAIKHDKKVLGTSEEQMDRLLASNYEWRNLNPFCVLQLPLEATDDDVSRRYKALSLLLHPDKNGSSDRAQQAYDQVQKAKAIMSDENRAKYTRQLMKEGMKIGKSIWAKMSPKEKKHSSLDQIQEREVMRIFAQVEQKRRDMEKREREFEQRERSQEDEVLEKERKERQFNKDWRKEERVDKRIGNWRDFSKKRKKR